MTIPPLVWHVLKAFAYGFLGPITGGSIAAGAICATTPENTALAAQVSMKALLVTSLVSGLNSVRMLLKPSPVEQKAQEPENGA